MTQKSPTIAVTAWRRRLPDCHPRIIGKARGKKQRQTDDATKLIQAPPPKSGWPRICRFNSRPILTDADPVMGYVLPLIGDPILRGETLVPKLPLFEEEKARALRVFKRLRLPDVIGTPRLGEVCGEWFYPIVQALFGSYDKSSNVRHISEVFQTHTQRQLQIHQWRRRDDGDGDSIVNRRPEAEFLFIAPTMEIALDRLQAGQGDDPSGPGIVDDLPGAGPYPQYHAPCFRYVQIKAADTDVITGEKPWAR